MTASLDEMYDEMLRGEFTSRGRHAAPDAEPAPAEVAWPHGPRGRHGRHVAAADSPIHDEFDVQPLRAAAGEAPVGNDGPRGLARYRNAVMVGAGGLACAGVGAFLGGLGGYFTVNPAAARSLVSSTAPDQQLAAAANQAQQEAGSAGGTQAVVTAALTSLSGSLTQNAAPLQWLTAQPGSLPVTAVGSGAGLPGAGPAGTGGTSGPGTGSGTGSGCTATTTDLGLGCVLGSLTTALGNVGSLPSDPDGDAREPGSVTHRRDHGRDRDAGRPRLAHADHLGPHACGRPSVAGPPRTARAAGATGPGWTR